MARIRLDALADAIGAELSSYGQEVTDEVKRVVKAAGEDLHHLAVVALALLLLLFLLLSLLGGLLLLLFLLLGLLRLVAGGAARKRGEHQPQAHQKADIFFDHQISAP